MVRCGSVQNFRTNKIRIILLALPQRTQAVPPLVSGDVPTPDEGSFELHLGMLYHESRDDHPRQVNIGGYLTEYGATPATPLTVLALAAGKWTAYYAASCLDGSAVAVQHWAGEVER